MMPLDQNDPLGFREIAEDKVENFQMRFGARELYLAMHAAAFASLSPELLYLLRENFQTDSRGVLLGIPFEAVADLLLSDLVSEAGHERFVMEKGVQQVLLEKLRDSARFGMPRLEALADFASLLFGPQLQAEQPEQRTNAEAQLWSVQLAVDPQSATHNLSELLAYAKESEDLSLQIRLSQVLDGKESMKGLDENFVKFSKGNALEAMGLQQDAQNIFQQINAPEGVLNIGSQQWRFEQQIESPIDDRSGFEIRLDRVKDALAYLGIWLRQPDTDLNRLVFSLLEFPRQMIPEKYHEQIMEIGMAAKRSENEEEMLIAIEEGLMKLRPEIPKMKVLVENLELAGHPVQPVLAYWGATILQGSSKHQNSIEKNTPDHSALSKGLKKGHMMLLGLDEDWLRSSSPEFILSEFNPEWLRVVRLVEGKCNWESSMIAKLPSILNIHTPFRLMDEIESSRSIQQFAWAIWRTHTELEEIILEEMHLAKPLVWVVHPTENKQLAEEVAEVLRTHGLEVSCSDTKFWNIHKDAGVGVFDGLVLIEGINGQKWAMSRINDLDRMVERKIITGNPAKLFLQGHPNRKEQALKEKTDWVHIPVQTFENNPFWYDFSQKVKAIRDERLNSDS